jgi:hypothetical protein
MPTPPLDYKTVTGQYVAPDGSVVAGTLRFIPSETVYDVAGNVIVPASPILVTLDGTGAFSVDLAVTTTVQSFSYATTATLAALDARVTDIEAMAAVINAGAVLLHPFLYMGA